MVERNCAKTSKILQIFVQDYINLNVTLVAIDIHEVIVKYFELNFRVHCEQAFSFIKTGSRKELLNTKGS